MHKLIALEGSPEYATIIESLLGSDGEYEVAVHPEPQGFQTRLTAEPHDLCIVDVENLEDAERDLEWISRSSAARILAIVRDPDESAMALRNGADYDLQKPFDPAVFIAAVEAVLRRSDPIGGMTVIGSLAVDPETRCVTRDGSMRLLTETEWRLFAYMVENPNRVLTRSELAQHIWGTKRLSKPRSIELNISRLRSKVEVDPRRPELIRTVRNRGYLFELPPPSLEVVEQQKGA